MVVLPCYGLAFLHAQVFSALKERVGVDIGT